MSRLAVLFALLSGTVLLPSGLLAAEVQTAKDKDEVRLFSVALETGKYWNGPEAENLKKLSKSHPIVLTWWWAELEDKLGVAADKVERLAIVAMAESGTPCIIRTKEPIDRKAVLAKMAPGAEPTTIGDQPYWAAEKAEYAVAFADPRTLLLVPAVSAKRFLTRHAATVWCAERLAAPGDAATGKTLLALEVNPRMLGDLLKPGDERAEPFRPLEKARSLQMKMEVDKELRAILAAEFADEAAAERGLPAVQKVLEGLAFYFDMVQENMPKFAKVQETKYPGAPEMVESLLAAVRAAQAGVKDAKAVRNGNRVEAAVTIKTDRPVSAAVLLLSLMPRAGKK
jgi:hypothetical protein